MEYVVIFVALVVLDYLSAEYTRAVAAGRSVAASLYAGGFTVASLLVTLEVISRPSLALAAGAGAIVGTAASMVLANRSKVT